MFWADSVAKDIIDSGEYKPYWVDDMFTPSGFAHVGSLRGPLVHDILYKAIKDTGKEVKWTYVTNDFDPIDGLPPELRKDFEKYWWLTALDMDGNTRWSPMIHLNKSTTEIILSNNNKSLGVYLYFPKYFMYFTGLSK